MLTYLTLAKGALTLHKGKWLCRIQSYQHNLGIIIIGILKIWLPLSEYLLEFLCANKVHYDIKV